MSKIALQGDASGTGTFTIASPNSNSNYTLNLPTATGTINTSGAVNEVPAGSASAPSIYPTGDTNTGIFFPAADTTAITTGGSERMRIDSSGNVGIGVTPSAWSLLKALQLPIGSLAGYDGGTGNRQINLFNNAYYDGANFKYIVTDTAQAYRIQAGAHQWYNAVSGTAGNNITFTSAMTLDASGNLGIGTSSPSSRLDVNSGSVQLLANFNTSAALGGYLQFQSSGTNYAFIGSGASLSGAGASDFTIRSQNALTFTSGGSSERARIDTSGNLLVGRTAENNTSPGFTFGLQLSGAAPIMKMVKSYSGGINALANYYSGTYVGGIDFSNTATSFPTSSDLRLKKNIAPSGSAFEKIENIRIVSHGWNHDDEVVDFGIVAQELYQVVPQAVIAGDDGEEIKKTWGVDYSKLVPVLVKAIQELKAELDTVKAELTALKGA
jgi:hypothetical protein